MTPFSTQGSARAWGGVCYAKNITSYTVGTTSRLAETSKSALPGEGRALPGKAGRRGAAND